MPELLTCCHEESSVAMAHGFAKIEGKPMMIMAHGTVGLQHASMAIYNAYADRVPAFIVLGNILDVNFRRSIVEWTHSVQDAAAMVRGYTKWDDTPVSLGHFAESAVRAYKIAMTPAMGPVVLVADGALQDEPVSDADRRSLRVPKLGLATPPAADPAAIAEAARMLVAAQNPVIIAGRVARTHGHARARAAKTIRPCGGAVPHREGKAALQQPPGQVVIGMIRPAGIANLNNVTMAAQEVRDPPSALFLLANAQGKGFKRFQENPGIERR